MKTLKFLFPALALMFFAVSSQAVTTSHRAAIEKLFTVLKMQKQYEAGMLAGYDAAVARTPAQLGAMTEEERTKFRNGVTKVKVRMIELMGWEQVKPDMIELYAKYFSEAEIADITKMMETPTGQMLVGKQLALIPEATSIGQKKAQAIMPELMKIMQDEMQ